MDLYYPMIHSKCLKRDAFQSQNISAVNFMKMYAWVNKNLLDISLL